MHHATAGSEQAAAIYSLIGTARLDHLDPEAHLRRVNGRITDRSANCVGERPP